MDSIAKLRAKLEGQWNELDADGDGKVSSGELLRALDKNKDGTVDESELQELSKQLQEQSDYTGYLIAQLQKMEEAQLAAQRESAKKDSALRQTFAIADKARAEASELARRLEISQEVLQKMSEQCKQARVEAGALRRELDRARVHAQSADAARTQAEAARTQVEQQLSAARTSGNAEAPLADSTQPDPQRMSVAAAAEVEVLRRAKDDALAAQARAEAEVGRLQLDISAGQAALLQLGEEADQAKARAKDASQKLAVVQQELHKATAGTRDSAATVAQLKARLVDEEAKVLVLEQELAHCRDNASVKHLEDSATKQRYAQQLQRVKALEAENLQLRQELEDVGADYLAQAKARAEEKSLAESSLRLAREERDRIASEARRRQKQHVAEAAAKAAEHQAQLATAQEQYNAVQRQLAAAQDQVSSLQQAQSHAAAEFASALKAATDRADALHDSVEALEAERAASTARARETTATLAGKVLEARKSTVSLAENHVASLSALQEALHALGQETATSRDDFSAVVSSLRQLQRGALSMHSQQHGPLEDWYTSVQATFLSMLDAVTDSQDRLEDARDQVAADAVRQEEVRQDNLMLQEQVSQLSHELALAKAKCQDCSAEAEHKNEELTSRLRDEVSQRKALQGQLVTTKEALAAANERVTTLQGELAASVSSLSSSHAQHGTRVAQLEHQLADARKEVRVKEQLYQAALAGKRTVESQAASVATQASTKFDELQAANMALRGDLAAREAMYAEAKETASNLSTEVSRVSARLAQTQQLLVVVREQKDELQAENQSLKRATSPTRDRQTHANDDVVA